MRTVALVLVIAACAPSRRAPVEVAAAPAPRAAPPARPAPAEPDPLGIDWRTLDYRDDEHALAIWDRLGLTGDNWQDRLSRIPEGADALREAMAKAVLRQGNFACPSTEIRLDCDRVTRELVPLGRDATLADPCLRRELAFWALDQLDQESLQKELAADLIAIAALPPPEEELNRAALARVDDEVLRLQMLEAIERAGNETVADEGLGSLSASGIEAAALQLHIDGAVEVLDASESASVYGRAVLDPKLRRETRVRAARELGTALVAMPESDPARAPTFADLQRATSDADCAVAGAAIGALATARGRETSLVPRKPDRRAYQRAFCAALHTGIDGDRAQFLGATGLVVQNDASGEDDPAIVRTIERVKLADLTELPFAAELMAALPGCTTDECRVPGTGTRLRLVWKRAGKRMVLEKIERRETEGC